MIKSPDDEYMEELEQKNSKLEKQIHTLEMTLAETEALEIAQGERVEKLMAQVTELEKERDGWQDEALGSRITVETVTAERDATLMLQSEANALLIEQARINETMKSALKVARDGIDEFLVANDPTEFGCACDLSVGYLCGPCHADKQQQPLKSALAKINEVLHD